MQSYDNLILEILGVDTPKKAYETILLLKDRSCVGCVTEDMRSTTQFCKLCSRSSKDYYKPKK